MSGERASIRSPGPEQRTPDEPLPPQGFRVADLSRSLRIPRATLYAWIRARRLPAVAVGKVLVVMQEDLERFLLENRTGHARDGGRRRGETSQVG